MTVIDARNVSKRFLLRHNASGELKVRFLDFLRSDRHQSVEEFWALRDVSLRIARGEAVGLVGRNGSGKSTFLKMVAAIHRPTSGQLYVARSARICSMIELGVGFHPELTGRENVFLNASIHGLSRDEVEEIYSRVVDYSGLAHFMDVPIKNYSSGMHMRVGFAIAANLDPDVLLLDEIFAVGDADFQQRCVATVKQFVEEGKTVLFVSHSPDSIRTICRRAIVLDHGALTYDGDVDGALDFYERHLTHHAEESAAGSASAPGDASDPTEADLDRSAHRAAFGGHWRETGAWQFELLRREQLQPHHYVLEVGCGSLSTAAHLLPFLIPGHYLGVERNIALLNAGRGVELPRLGIASERGYYLISSTFDLPDAVGMFDVALASSLFAYLPFNSVARCLVSVVRKLRPGGHFYATWFENPDVANVDPITRANGVVTYPDREPFHYPLSLIAAVCEAVGASVERLSDDTHPRGESLIVVTRRN